MVSATHLHDGLACGRNDEHGRMSARDMTVDVDGARFAFVDVARLLGDDVADGRDDVRKLQLINQCLL